MAEQHGGPVSPTSHMLNSLGITRQDLERHTSQMRSFLSNGGPTDGEEAPAHHSRVHYGQQITPNHPNLPEGSSTSDNMVKDEPFEELDALPERPFNSMDYDMRGQLEKRRPETDSARSPELSRTPSHAGINLDTFMNSMESKRTRRKSKEHESGGGNKTLKTPGSSARRSSKTDPPPRQGSQRIKNTVFTHSPLPASSPLAPSPLSSPDAAPQLPYKLPPGPYGGDKPSISYSAILGRAILSSPKHRLTLQEIYSWMMTVFPYYKVEEKTWQASIRHVLSTTACFRKVPRPRSEGRTLWAIFDEDVPCFDHGGFNKMLCKEMADEIAKNPKKDKAAKAAAAAANKKRANEEAPGDETRKKLKKGTASKDSGPGQSTFTLEASHPLPPSVMAPGPYLPVPDAVSFQPQAFPVGFVVPPGFTMVPVYAGGAQAYYTLVGTQPALNGAPGAMNGAVSRPVPAGAAVASSEPAQRAFHRASKGPRPPSSMSSASSSASLPVLSPNRSSSSSDNITTPEQERENAAKKGRKSSSGARIIEERMDVENDGETSSMGYSRSGSSFVDDSLAPSRANSSWDATSAASSHVEGGQSSRASSEEENRDDAMVGRGFEPGFLLRHGDKGKAKVQYKQNPLGREGSPTDDRKSARPVRRPLIRMTSSSLQTAVVPRNADYGLRPGFSRTHTPQAFDPDPEEEFPPSSSPPREGFSTPPQVISPYDNVSNMRTPIPHQGLDLSPSPSLAHFRSHMHHSAPPSSRKVSASGSFGSMTPSQDMGIDPAMFASDMRTPPPRSGRPKKASLGASIFPAHPATPLARTMSPYFRTPGGPSPFGRSVYDHMPSSVLDDELLRIRDLESRGVDSPNGIFRSGMLYESPTMSSPSQWE